PPVRQRQGRQSSSISDRTRYRCFEALAQLWQQPIPGRKGAAEQGPRTERCPLAGKLFRRFKSQRSASAVAGNDIRTAGLEGADLSDEISREVLHALQRLAVTIETRRLQAEEGLILTQVLSECVEAENIAVVAANSKNRRPCAAGLQRH